MFRTKRDRVDVPEFAISRESQKQNMKIALLGTAIGAALITGPNSLIENGALENEHNADFLQLVENTGDIYGLSALALSGIALAALRSKEANKV